MNEEGQPIELATVNRWVIDDKYVKADVLKNFIDNFHMDSNLFVERRVVEFVENVIRRYSEAIHALLMNVITGLKIMLIKTLTNRLKTESLRYYLRGR